MDWNARAERGLTAGTDDLLAKELEMRAIMRHVPPGASVLDVGCGNGVLLRRLQEDLGISAHGMDTSDRMIAEATAEGAKCWVGAAVSLLIDYDVIVTERLLINLPTWAEQRKTIEHLARHSKRLLLVECSLTALAQLNLVRLQAGLKPIAPPPHTNYLSESLMAQTFPEARLVRFSDTYYFLSRVVNAAVHEDPDYFHPINRLALSLPQDLIRVPCGQVVLWILEKP